jgi:hypothetical protein
MGVQTPPLVDDLADYRSWSIGETFYLHSQAPSDIFEQTLSLNGTNAGGATTVTLNSAYPYTTALPKWAWAYLTGGSTAMERAEITSISGSTITFTTPLTGAARTEVRLPTYSGLYPLTYQGAAGNSTPGTAIINGRFYGGYLGRTGAFSPIKLGLSYYPLLYINCIFVNDFSVTGDAAGSSIRSPFETSATSTLVYPSAMFYNCRFHTITQSRDLGYVDLMAGGVAGTIKIFNSVISGSNTADGKTLASIGNNYAPGSSSALMTGTALGGTSTSITLPYQFPTATLTTWAACHYGAFISLTGGAGSGQTRWVNGFALNAAGTARVATVSQAWTVPPDSTTMFAIYHQANNAYMSLSSNSGFRGYDNDPFAIEAGFLPIEANPVPGSILLSANSYLVQNRYRLEYDIDYNKRSASTPAVGAKDIKSNVNTSGARTIGIQ